MTDVLEKQYGRVVGVARKTYGSILTAAAGIADTVLHVATTDDFDVDEGGQIQEGGQVVIAGELYGYVEVDKDALTLTLDTGLLAAADVDTFVELYDPEVDGIVVEYVADVLLDDQDPRDEPIEVTVQHGLVNMLAEHVRGGAAEAVVLIRDGEDDWMIWQIDGKLAVDVVLEDAISAIDVVLEQLNTDLTELNDVTLVQVQADLTELNTVTLPALQGLFPITSTSISDGAITTPKMTANSINGDRIAANTLHANKIVANSITGDKIQANSIGADQIIANSIGADELAANSVTAGKIAAGAITAVAASGGGVNATLSGASSPSGSAGLAFTPTSGSAFMHSLYSSSSVLTLYSNNACTITAPTLSILSDSITQSATAFLGTVTSPRVEGDEVFVLSTPVSTGGEAVFMTGGGRLIVHTAPSLLAYKRDVSVVEVDTDALAQVRPITWRYRDDVPFEISDPDETFWGIPADPLLDSPGLAFLTHTDAEGIVSVKEQRLPLALLAAFGEQHARIVDLERQRAEDRRLIERLAARLEALEA